MTREIIRWPKYPDARKREYRQIYNHEDSITLQQDLDNLAAWGKMWGMQFHPEKFISLSVTRSQIPFHTSYILKGHTLESVTTAKYLGITISKDMNWDTHINNITSKANKIIGFLRRNLPIQNTETKIWHINPWSDKIWNTAQVSGHLTQKN